jgi:hypothetical protein
MNRPSPATMDPGSYQPPEFFSNFNEATAFWSGGNFSYALFERLHIVRKVRDLSPTERQVRHARMGP